MKSFQETYTELQDITGDDSAEFLVMLKRWINDTMHSAYGTNGGKMKFLEATKDITTAASTARYALPGNCRRIMTVTTTPDSGATIYRPRPVDDPDYWNYLQSRNAGDSDITQFYYREGDDLLVWPDYASASKTITVRYRKTTPDLSRADYTTGTITSITNGDETLTGASTSWLARKPAAGQWIRIDYTSGDFLWYRVDSITSDTVLELDRKYNGTSIAADTETYTMGEFSELPGEFHPLLFYRPLALAYDHMENPTMSARYWNLYDGGHEAGLSTKVGGMLKKMIDEQSGITDSGYYPPMNTETPISPEDLSREDLIGEGW